MNRGATPSRKWLLWLMLFSALSSLGGGAELLLFPRGNAYVPLTLLHNTPFTSFVVPGLLLFGVVGASSALASALLIRRSDASLDLSLLAGGVLTFWIACEVALMRSFHWLHGLYGLLGLVMLLLAVRLSLQDGRLRLRWTIVVTFAEAVGFGCPLLTGVLLHGRLSETTLAFAITLAGFFEGLSLGTGQALAWPLPLARLRYALLSGLGAMLVWALAMGIVVHAEAFPRMPVLAQVAASLLGGGMALCAIGGAQWLELRKHAKRAHVFIGYTAIAWILALPMSFLPSPLVDDSTPPGVQVVLWSSAGCLMAYVMALVTYRGAAHVLRSQ